MYKLTVTVELKLKTEELTVDSKSVKLIGKAEGKMFVGKNPNGKPTRIPLDRHHNKIKGLYINYRGTKYISTITKHVNTEDEAVVALEQEEMIEEILKYFNKLSNTISTINEKALNFK